MRLTADGKLEFVKNADTRNAKGHVTKIGGVFGRWTGGEVLEMSSALVNNEARHNDEFIRTGPYTLRVSCMRLDLRLVTKNFWPDEVGEIPDTHLLMRDGWKARALCLYFNAAVYVTRRVAAAERRVGRLVGFDSDPEAPSLAAQVGKRLLSLEAESQAAE